MPKDTCYTSRRSTVVVVFMKDVMGGSNVWRAGRAHPFEKCKRFLVASDQMQRQTLETISCEQRAFVSPGTGNLPELLASITAR